MRARNLPVAALANVSTSSTAAMALAFLPELALTARRVFRLAAFCSRVISCLHSFCPRHSISTLQLATTRTIPVYTALQLTGLIPHVEFATPLRAPSSERAFPIQCLQCCLKSKRSSRITPNNFTFSVSTYLLFVLLHPPLRTIDSSLSTARGSQCSAATSVTTLWVQATRSCILARLASFSPVPHPLYSPQWRSST